MENSQILTGLETKEFKNKILLYGSRCKNFAFFDSNFFSKSAKSSMYYEYDFLAAIHSTGEILDLDELQNFCTNHHEWLFGYLTYDLKNKIEVLDSRNIDQLEFPELHFFIPEIVIYSKNSVVSVLYHDEKSKNRILDLITGIEENPLKNEKSDSQIGLNQRFSKEEYVNTVKRLKEHIQYGDIYELNFCQEFYTSRDIDPLHTYKKLNEVSPTPFSCFYKTDDKFLFSASPERFLKKIKTKVISQPIKGTIKRGENDQDDDILKSQLLNDPKERAENVMIVDLVRNDLSRTAKKGSVFVEELYGIYSFKQVHQMISTVSSEVSKEVNIIEIIKNAFPMGSMTGAPKIKAMQLIEKYEKTKRGLYSGSVGYITPYNDFDFNVVIRSILYNQSKKYVSFTVGGAITSLSDPEKEYEECMVKAEAMVKALS